MWPVGGSAKILIFFFFSQAYIKIIFLRLAVIFLSLLLLNYYLNKPSRKISRCNVAPVDKKKKSKTKTKQTNKQTNKQKNKYNPAKMETNLNLNSSTDKAGQFLTSVRTYA